MANCVLCGGAGRIAGGPYPTGFKVCDRCNGEGYEPATLGAQVSGEGRKEVKLARYDLIPPEVLHELAEHYGRGAQKYDPRNWERGYAWGKTFAALMRHAWAFWMGQKEDPEGGSPLIAVAWHAFTLRAFELRGIGTDDRSKKGPKP